MLLTEKKTLYKRLTSLHAQILQTQLTETLNVLKLKHISMSISNITTNTITYFPLQNWKGSDIKR